ncbi:MAG: ATP-binding cassette domain-containing protein [Solirubrobacteraceae bacterium]
MSPLLELAQVSKRGVQGRRERVLLDRVCMRVQAGELAVVLSANHHESRALLRIAAGLEAPDSGVVRFDGRDLARAGEELRGVQVGYVQRSLRGSEGRSVLSLTAAALLAHGLTPSRANEAAHVALERVGAESCARLPASDLGEEERVRVALARTLALAPRLVVVDEPIKGVTPLQRDELLRLLRKLSSEGVAVLVGTADPAGLTGADRAFSLDGGRLAASSEPQLAAVLQLRRATG